LANPTIKSIRRSARRYGIDPRAAVAVALGEGGLVNREGDVGDLSGGGSYGPFQLYAQGALPSQYRGQPQQADVWAWSPAGIDYAIRKMAESGARGLSGPKAVETIVRKFERPADPDTSVQRATSRYGSITPQQYPGLFARSPGNDVSSDRRLGRGGGKTGAVASASAGSTSSSPGGSSLLASLLLSSPYDDEGAEPDDTLVRALSSRLSPPSAQAASTPIASALSPTPTPPVAPAPAPTGGPYPFNFFRGDFTPLGAPGQGTHGYGERGYLWQDDEAYDFGAPAGTPILLPANIGDATVEEVRPGSTSGRFGGTKVYLRTPRGRVFLTHMDDVRVKPGQKLRPGDLIGHVGNIEGLSPHLHAAFEWLSRGRRR